MATIAIAVAAGGAQPAAAARFDPRVHGLHFVNVFKGEILVTIPRIGTVDLAKYPFGLCGGMAFAALDTFLAGGEAPADTRPPSPGDRLRRYLRERLLDSLVPDGARVVFKFISWMARPLEDKDLFVGKFDGLRSLTRKELEKTIHPSLQAGRPIPIGIVKVDFSRPPWENHTVLAVGDFKDAAGNWVVEIYDPNFPDRITYLHVGRRVQTYDRAGKEPVRGSKPWRGLFAIPYRYEKPYWVS